MSQFALFASCGPRQAAGFNFCSVSSVEADSPSPGLPRPPACNWPGRCKEYYLVAHTPAEPRCGSYSLTLEITKSASSTSKSSPGSELTPREGRIRPPTCINRFTGKRNFPVIETLELVTDALGNLSNKGSSGVQVNRMPTDLRTLRPSHIIGHRSVISCPKSLLHWWRPFSSLTRYPAVEVMPNMTDLVTDISLVANWDPRVEGSSAEVFLYTKIIPQPAAKVSLLHLQSLVTKTTLLRIIPLLPDGSSPRESEGIRTLGISVVAGRNTAVPKIPIGQRRVSEITLDGVGSDFSSEAAYDDSVKGSRLKMTGIGVLVKREADGAVLGNAGDGLVSFLSVSGSTLSTPEGPPGNRDRRFIMAGRANDETIIERVSDEDLFPTPLKGLCGTYYSSFRRGCSISSGESLVSDMATSYSQGTNGNFRTADKEVLPLDRPRDSCKTRNHGRKNRVFSISSVQRSLSPMSEKAFRRIVELHAPIERIYAGGQDGTTENPEAVLCSSEAAAERAAAAKEDDTTSGEDGIPVEGEIIMQISPETNESESEEIKMIIEQDTIFICFPRKIRGDPVVVEIMLEITPLYLAGKPYVTFIFAGLPYCKNGAYINFQIHDEDDWKFKTFPEITLFDMGGFQENRCQGILELTGNLYPVAANRSLIIRALRRPTVLELLDFTIKTDTTAVFSWSSKGNQVTSEFEISLVFLNLKPDDDANRCMINLYLVNGPERQSDMVIDSPGEISLDFVLGDLEFEKYEVCARRCRLLRIERSMKNARQPLRIRFNKQLGSNPKEVGIPAVRVAGEATLIEESVIIIKPRLPLEVVFSPNSTSWEKIDEKSEVKVSTKFRRTGINMREAGPSIFISCLNPVISSTIEGIGKTSVANDEFIGRVSYEIEDSENFNGNSAQIVAVKLSFGLYIPVGLGPMEEIVRIHNGSFEFNFATINDELAAKGVLFEDGDELLILNYGFLKGSENNNEYQQRLLVSTEWFCTRSLIISSGEMEFKLPRLTARIVGRTDFECGNQQARIVSRVQNHNTSSRFTRSRVIITGMDTSKSEIYLQVPCRKELETPKVSIGTRSSSPRITEASLTPLLSWSPVSFHSVLEDLDSAQEQRQGKLETSAHHVDSSSSGVPSSYWIWSTKKIIVMFLMIGVLCFNMVSQSARNSALKASLRKTRAILEERDRTISEISSPDNLLFQSQRNQRPGQKSEDIWWSVGNGDAHDIGHLTIDVVAMGHRHMGSTCDTKKSTADGEKPTDGQDSIDPNNEKRHTKEGNLAEGVGASQKEVGGDELQKRLGQIMLEDETFSEKTHRVLVNVFSLFWAWIFGV